MKKLLLLFLLITSLYGTTEQNRSSTAQDANSSFQITDNITLKHLNLKLAEIESNSDIDNEWTKTYSAFITHKNLLTRESEINKEIKKYKSLRSLTKIQEKRVLKDEKDLAIIKDKINLIKGFEKDPFKKLIAPPALDDAPIISNPFAIIGGLSYLKELTNRKNSYISKYEHLSKTIIKLGEEYKILSEIVAITNSAVEKDKLKELDKEINYLKTIQDIFKTTKNIYLKKADEVKISIENGIKKELQKVVYIAVVAAVFLIIFLFLKYLTRKYFADKESFYTINKVINVTFITVLIIIILFAYLENVSYLITILGFASAGIAIAMKDWFMSLMGWFVIVLGGAVHVGDRVKFVRGNVEYVGDIVDISLLRMTIQEDVTLTTYMHNRRAGRIIFVPNNFIFTDMVANYSHSGLKTVWDGIDFYITFDSNITKANSIAKNVAKQYSKGYTDITRKQLNKLRSKYQLKNTNVEPRVFAFIEGHGMRVSVWYLTNAYATLTLRGTISTKIIEEIQQEDDIKIAYPTQSIYFDKSIPKPVVMEE